MGKDLIGDSEEDGDEDCEHEWENSRCELCGIIHDLDDFSAASEVGER